MASQLMAADALIRNETFTGVIQAAAMYVALEVMAEDAETPHHDIRMSLANLFLYGDSPAKNRQVTTLAWLAAADADIRTSLVDAGTGAVTMTHVNDGDVIALVQDAWDQLAGASNASAPGYQS